MALFRTTALVLVLGGIACSGPPRDPLIFADGRAVAPIGDTAMAFAVDDPPSVLRLDLLEHGTDTVGQDILVSPVHVQAVGDELYVSDIRDGDPSIVIFDAEGNAERRIDVGEFTPTPHQFAVLPDKRIVLIGRDQQLVALAGDSLEIFALTEAGPRPSLLLGALGGVLHAVPDRAITLYNGFGNVRWRVDWPWAESAFVTDLAIDALGRLHVIAGITGTGQEQFIVYSLVPQTGEVTRWSQEGPSATFVAQRLGNVVPANLSDWIN